MATPRPPQPGRETLVNWNQPFCDDCWDAEHPDRVAARVVTGELETCAVCGNQTRSGIYVRRHPSEVAFPAKDDEG